MISFFRYAAILLLILVTSCATPYGASSRTHTTSIAGYTRVRTEVRSTVVVALLAQTSAQYSRTVFKSWNQVQHFFTNIEADIVSNGVISPNYSVMPTAAELKLHRDIVSQWLRRTRSTTLHPADSGAYFAHTVHSIISSINNLEYDKNQRP